MSVTYISSDITKCDPEIDQIKVTLLGSPIKLLFYHCEGYLPGDMLLDKKAFPCANNRPGKPNMPMLGRLACS